MSKLQRQIKMLDAQIYLDEARLRHEYLQFKHQITKSDILPFAVLGSFVVGYLLSRKKSLPQLMHTFVVTPMTAKRLYKQIKLFLPFMVI